MLAADDQHDERSKEIGRVLSYFDDGSELEAVGAVEVVEPTNIALEEKMDLSIFAKFTFLVLGLHKIHDLEISLFTKFKFTNSHGSQNSHSPNLIFHKIPVFHIFTILFFTEITFWAFVK